MLPLISQLLMSLYMGRARRRTTHTFAARCAVLGAAERVWSEVAAARGLEPADPDGFRLRFDGAIHGVGCELSLLETEIGFQSSLRVLLPIDAAAGMRLTPRATTWARAARVLGRGLATGDVDFDRAFTVVTDSTAGARVTLDAAARAALLAVRQREPHVSWRRREVLLEMEGAELGHEALLDLIDALVRAPATAQSTPYR